MRIAALILLSAATIAAAVVPASRQRTLRDLQAVNLSLQQQLEAASVTPEPSAAAPAPSTDATAELTSQEQNELLRLRGQIQPLRRELASLSNSLPSVASPGAQDANVPPGTMTPSKQAKFQAMRAFSASELSRDAYRLGAAVAKYLKQNGGQLPDNLARLEPAFSADLPAGTLQKFELMRSGTISEEDKASALIAREKEPRPSSDGRWGRAYVRANGTVVIGMLEDAAGPAAWAAWERSTERIAQREARAP